MPRPKQVHSNNANRWVAEKNSRSIREVMKRFFKLLTLLIVISFILLGCFNSRALTPEEVVDQQDKWLEEVITVRGIVGTLYTSCTEVACPPRNPCCNSCTAMFGLYTDVTSFPKLSDPKQPPYAYETNAAAIGLEFPNEGGCLGNECEISCKPLELGKSYVITGLLVECYSVPRCILKVEKYEQK